MAMTLRDLRTKAKELGISFEKETPKEELERIIAEKMIADASVAPLIAEAAAQTIAEALTKTPPALSIAPSSGPTPEDIAAIAADLAEDDANDFVPAEQWEAPDAGSKPSSSDAFNPDALLKISEANLSQNIIEQASFYAWAGQKNAEAQDRMLRAKAALELTEADLSIEHREKFSASKEKVTEAMIRAAVLSDSRYQSSQERYFQAVKQAGVSKAYLISAEQRKDMLIQLSSTRRMEMDQAFVIKSKIA